MLTTKIKWQAAQQLYEKGVELFQGEQYKEAIAELRKAEDAFREIDAEGQPFGQTLPNGVSGHANSLLVKGRCYQKLGDYQTALTCFENSLINEKFENNGPFRVFLRDVRLDLAACYEKILEYAEPGTALNPATDPVIDVAFLFPFSLPPELIPLARLYETVPERYPQFAAFYSVAKKKDALMRKMDKRSDDSTMRRMSFYVWGGLIAIWVAYGIFVVRSLSHK